MASALNHPSFNNSRKIKKYKDNSYMTRLPKQHNNVKELHLTFLKKINLELDQIFKPSNAS